MSMLTNRLYFNWSLLYDILVHVHGNESMISGLYDPLYDYIVQRIMKWIFTNGKTKLHSFINQYLFPWQIYRCMIFFQY